MSEQEVPIHAPTRAATKLHRPSASASCRFNPRAHEGRDRPAAFASAFFRSFQSTRPRGARRRARNCCSAPASFNPRAHEGRDVVGHFGLNITDLVSIHAPTRGATPASRRRRRPGRCFNPRAHEGRDDRLPSHAVQSLRFQSTRPRGARPGPDAHQAGVFQVSIHAPTRGATFRLLRVDVDRHVSIHAPTRGATARPAAGSRRAAVSIHAPTRGATHLALRLHHRCVVSIHAPTRGATRSG